MTRLEAAAASSPTISIVLPTCNRAQLLPRAIESVLRQTFDDWELLVVDDCSMDKTGDVVRGYQDSRVRYIRRETNGGEAASRNTGIRATGTSRFVAHLDDDDEWMPEKLAKQMAVFQSGAPDLAVVGCGRSIHSADAVTTVGPTQKGWIFEHLLAGRATGWDTSVLLVKRLAESSDIRFDRNFAPFTDRDYLLRFARNYTVDFVPEPLVDVHRDFQGSHLTHPGTAIRGYAALLRRYARDIDARPRVRRYYQLCIAKEFALLGRVDEARMCLAEALKTHRRDPKLFIWFAASFFGSSGVCACSRFLPNRPPSVSPREINAG